jgi:transcriptional regulator with XRE-family HTH domain
MTKSWRDVADQRDLDEDLVAERQAQLLATTRAQQLRRLREEAGLTQTQLAERLGVTPARVAKIENRELNRVRLGLLRRYIEALGGELTVEAVFGEGPLRLI